MSLRQIEIARDEKTWTALKNNLFDAIFIPLDHAHDTDTERRLFRLGAKAFADACPR